MVTVESPLTGVLTSRLVLDTAARLAGSSRRFASASVTDGMARAETRHRTAVRPRAHRLGQRLRGRTRADRHRALNEAVSYHESMLDPNRLQLVEARGASDVELAACRQRPGFAVSAVQPGESMVYKTALTRPLRPARLRPGPPARRALPDVVDRGGHPPRGQIIGVDPTPFLRPDELTGADPGALPTTATAARAQEAHA
jgi:hypothetical protein